LIRNSGLFCAAFGTSTFIVASLVEYERIRAKAINARKSINIVDWVKKQQSALTEKQNDLNNEIARLKREMKALWNQLPAGERVWAPILALNVVVFGLWRAPSLRPMMMRYFASNPASQSNAVYWSMFFSTFSHYSLFHLFANMYVLRSFSAAVNSLGKEQFVALYLTAGVFSSYASYVLKTLTHTPGFSLGASGAIMAIVAYVCAKYPETQLSILFVPQWHFSAGSAIQCLMLFDLVGVLLRWRLFDHAAHLGGAAMGLFWAYYGKDKIWPQREYIIGIWHQLRGKPPSK
jgi:rhomboid-like protein